MFFVSRELTSGRGKLGSTGGLEFGLMVLFVKLLKVQGFKTLLDFCNGFGVFSNRSE